MKLLFIFLDGVGLGPDEPATNPFARAELPNLADILGGRRLVDTAFRTAESQDGAGVFPDLDIPVVPGGRGGSVLLENGHATLLALDACLGIDGLPQSATGQAALLTGRNVPARLGYHQGPRPNRKVARILRESNLFLDLRKAGRRAALLNAYPPIYFDRLGSGRPVQAAIALAVTSAKIPLLTSADLYAGRALSADFTARGWRERLGFSDAPLLETAEAGERLVALARDYDFALFEFWLTDYAGHRRDMDLACQLLETFDQVLGRLLEVWSDEEGLILITSDHGNLEDLSTRRHTRNQVPALIIGDPRWRAAFSEGLRDLTDLTPAVLRLFAHYD